MQEEKSPRSNKARTEATRAALITAARALFAEHGYAATSTPQIVQAADVTRGALYHHFRDKSDLFRAVLEAEAQSVAKAIDADAQLATSPLEALMQGADAYFRAMAFPGRAKLLLVEGPVALGLEQMAQIDAATGGETLRVGLSHAFSNNVTAEQLDARSELLSAAFDRAALAIARGARPEPYREAMQTLVRVFVEADD